MILERSILTRRGHVALSAGLAFLAAAGGLLLLLATGGGGGGGASTGTTLLAAVRATCPACPACHAGHAREGGGPQHVVQRVEWERERQQARTAALQEQAAQAGAKPNEQQDAQREPAAQQQQQQHPTPPPPPPQQQQQQQAPDPALICGGPAQVPSPDEAVAAAAAAMERGPEEDLAPWAGGFTRGDIEATMNRLGINGGNDLHIYVEVKGNQLHFPLRRVKDACVGNCNYMVATLLQGLNKGLAEGKLTIPEGLPMLWNVHDWGICWDEAEGTIGCPAPVFSVIRHATSHYDALMPNFREPLHPEYIPWAEKKEQAWFRGTPFCAPHPLSGDPLRPATCSRLSLPGLSDQHPGLLNITINVDALGTKATPMRPLTYHEQAHYKYLVALVGISASNRLAALLGMNSLVLKQASRQQEWYYRALKPCVHYLPFWMDNTTDILPLVTALKANKANDEVARRVAANGQAFALSQLSEDARWRYWQSLFDRYASLYKGGMPGDPPSTNKTVLPSTCYGCKFLKLEQEAEEGGRRRTLQADAAGGAASRGSGSGMFAGG